MIKKTLIITIQEKDSITKELHDIVELKRGNKTENIVLKFANPSGQLLVDKQDLYDGIREIELFYGDSTSKKLEESAPTPTQLILDNKTPQVDTQLSVDSVMETMQIIKELNDASQTVHIPIVYGEDGA